MRWYADTVVSALHNVLVGVPLSRNTMPPSVPPLLRFLIWGTAYHSDAHEYPQ